MYNSDKPKPDDLPTARQLAVSTLLALAAAAAILLVVVLPAEYALDPSGMGRWLGLTQMGEIKMQLAKEAALDAKRDAERAARKASAAATGAAPSANPAGNRDEKHRIQIAAGGAVEFKLLMQSGERAEFRWQVEGDGLVNFDQHAHSDDGQTVSYEKGRAASSQEGVMEAEFAGEHGWFWRNLGDTEISLVLHTNGQYADVEYSEL